MKRDQPEADWLAWALQFVFGMLVGGVVAWGIAMGGRYSRGWTHAESLPVWVAGLMLLGGGAAACWGDRMWMGRSDWCDRKPKHTAFSLGLARMALGSGCGLAVAAVGWRLTAG